MNQGFEGVKKKTEKIINTIDEYAVLVDEKNDKIKLPALNNLSPGLGMATDADLYKKSSEDIKQGIFKVLAMGEFKNGKSTVLNSMIGGKILPARAIATTAIITILVYGEFTNKASVYFKGKEEPVEMPLEEFNEKYRLTPEDEDLIEKQGYLDRFADVDYAVIQCDYSLCQNGVRLIDSPGLADRKSATEVVENYVPNANAIIFLLRADRLFSLDEKTYVNDNFTDKNLRNVFFVVNRINQIHEEEVDSIKESTKYYLKPVFTNENGEFDEELYNKRVFFVDAYGALVSKQNGNSEGLNKSGVPNFEKELEEFLTSDERFIATFQSTLNTMANSYVRAEGIVKTQKAQLKAPLAKLEEGYVASEKELNSLDVEMKGIEKAFNTTKTLITSKVFQDLNDYVSNMERSWEEDSQAIETKIGIKEMLKLAGSSVVNIFNAEKRKQKQEEIIKPIGEAVGKYIENKLEDWSDGIEDLIEPELNNLKLELKEYFQAIDIKLVNAAKLFTGDLDKGETFENDNMNGLQFAISLVQGDVSVMVTNAAGGGLTWGEYLKKYIVQAVMQVMIFSVLGGPVGLIAFVGMEFYQMTKGASAINDKILYGMKSKLFAELKQSIAVNRSSLEDKISTEMSSQAGKVTKGIASHIKEVKDRQKSIIGDKKKAQFDEKIACERLDGIISYMYKLLNDVNTEMYGKGLSKEEIYKIATQNLDK